METIKNYLETMFANMPNTDSVKKAKSELLAMMEDKYTELINEGRSTNEAVGTVIAEFGNLEDLAEELGVASEVQEERRASVEQPRRHVTLEEVSGFMAREVKSALMIATGVFFCIICVNFPIISEVTSLNEGIAVGLMCCCILVAIGLFVFNANTGKEWDFITNERCQIDKATVDFFAKEHRRNIPVLALMKAVGVILCAGCWIPAAVLDSYANVDDSISAIALFLMVGVGVFLLIYSAKLEKSYRRIRTINDENTISGTYGQNEEVTYSNKTVAAIMSIFWPTVTCVYLIWSFLTFDWHISWVIWPIAGVINALIKTTCREDL